MSRTDKDRPWWVQNFQDGPELYNHNHTSGECILESLELAKWWQHRGWRHRHADCAKYVTVEYNCTKNDPFTKVASYWPSYRRVQTCWTWECVCPIPETWKHEFHACENRRYVECAGHTHIEFQRDVPCSCDTWPSRPTCDRTRVDGAKGGYRRYTWGGVPSEFVRTYYHGPERARERKLNDFAREYNTYGDIEDDDFDNRQARNSCRWLYW